MTFSGRIEHGWTVAVVGSGFSGLLTAIHLLAADPDITVRLVEKAPRFGVGRAYSPSDPDHLLNVRVANMSAFPDRPSHFRDWLISDDGHDRPEAFVRRSRYGDYLQGLLREAMARPGTARRLLLEHDEAVRIGRASEGYRVELALGRSLAVDAVVLAMGLGPPRLLPGASPDVLSLRTYVGDPWRGDLDDLPTQGEILLVGSGLTMVDVALTLERPGRDLVAVSRHGFLPRMHATAPEAPAPTAPMHTPLRALQVLRQHARAVGWRSAVDSIRPMTPAIWQGWPLKERKRFLRHLQPWWDAHRHRQSPAAAERLGYAGWNKRFACLAGRVESLEPAEQGIRARIRLRGRPLAVTRHFRAVVNCTGLSSDPRSSRLLKGMLDRGLVRRDALELGLDVDASGRLIGREGHSTPGAYAVGPLTRGAFWEAIAVPDLRWQAAKAAAAIAADLRTRAEA